MTSIGHNAFYKCSSLPIEDNLRYADTYLVEAVDKTFSTYNIKEGTRFIGSSAFINCFDLTSIIIPEGVTSIEDDAFFDCFRLTSIIIPKGVTNIEDGAFYKCSGLTSINIPSSVTNIGKRAFNSENLASVTLKGETPIDITKDVFNDLTYKVARLYVPSTAIQKYENTAVWNEFWSINAGEPGDCNPSYIAVPSYPERNVYVANNASVSAFNVRLSNLGKRPIRSLSFYVSVNGVDEEEQTYTLPRPVSADNCIELPITLAGTYSTGKYDMAYTITKVNGVDIKYGADYMIRGCGKMIVFTPVAKHSVFIEEYTSTSCEWALRGKVGIKALEELYGNRIVHMAVHLDKAMWSVTRSYTPITPTCRINNSWDLLDPYYGSSKSTPFGIKDDVEKYLNEPSPGSIKILNVAWADPERTSIKVVVETTFGFDDTDAPFVIGFNILEDKMKGSGPDWIQRNAYAGVALNDPNLQPLALLPGEISDMEYDHVAVQWYNPIEPGKSPYRADTPQQVTYTIELRKNSIIQDKDNLSVVAYLYDNSDDYDSSNVLVADKSAIEVLLGDVNNDNIIDVADLSGVVRFILDDADDILVFNAADMDSNGLVEVNDFAAIVNLILSQGKNGVKARRSPALSEQLVSLSSNSEGDLLVTLMDDRRFTGMQLDLALPEGVSLEEGSIETASTQHGCWSVRHEDGSYRILCSSMSNAELQKGVVLRLKTEGNATGEAIISNVVLSDVNSQRYEIALVRTNLGDATGIMATDNGQLRMDNEVYDLTGQRVQKIQKKGIYIVNGKRLMIK